MPTEVIKISGKVNSRRVIDGFSKAFKIDAAQFVGKTRIEFRGKKANVRARQVVNSIARAQMLKTALEPAPQSVEDQLVAMKARTQRLRQMLTQALAVDQQPSPIKKAADNTWFRK